MWSRCCLPFRNTRVSPTCGACTVYPTGTKDLVPHVEQELHTIRNARANTTCGVGTAYSFGTHELVPHVK